jgi:hypothetical protein
VNTKGEGRGQERRKLRGDGGIRACIDTGRLSHVEIVYRIPDMGTSLYVEGMGSRSRSTTSVGILNLAECENRSLPSVARLPHMLNFGCMVFASRIYDFYHNFFRLPLAAPTYSSYQFLEGSDETLASSLPTPVRHLNIPFGIFFPSARNVLAYEIYLVSSSNSQAAYNPATTAEVCITSYSIFSNFY